MQNPDGWQRIAIPPEGDAAVFSFQCGDHMEDAFAICYHGEIYAYRNHCPHAGSTLDWVPGRFFTEDGRFLICQTHGAMFEPHTGACAAGPCTRGLDALPHRRCEDGVEVPSSYSQVPWPTG